MMPESTLTYRQRTHALEDLAGMTQAMHRDGFVLVPGVLSPAEVERLRAAIDRLEPLGFDAMGATEH